MRNLYGLAISALVAIGVTTPAFAATEWTMSTSLAANNFLTENIRQFVVDAERLSEGNLKINLVTDGVLYKRAIHKRVLQEGQVPLAEIDFNQYGNEDPVYVLVNIPGLVNSLEELRTLWEIEQVYFDGLFAEKGMRILYVGHWPGQGFYTKNPMNTLDDVKGQRLRVASVEVKRMSDLLGFVGTVLPSAEVPQAFATGLIDAMFTSAQTGVDTQAWDHLSYFSLAIVGSATSAVAVNEAAFQQLDPKSQEALIEAGRLAYERSFPMIEEANVSTMKVLEENGMTTGMLAPAIAEELHEVGRVMLDEWRQQASPEANQVLDEYLAAVGS
jgi:TRAP-type transport system periplasmic protein